MIGSATFFDLLFGWGFVVIAILLVVFFFVVLRTMGSFKNADKAKGKIINLTDIGAQSLPQIEYEFKGEKLSFKTKTDKKDLKVGQSVEVEISNTNEARLYESDRQENAPKILFMIAILIMIFTFKSIGFLQTYFG